MEIYTFLNASSRAIMQLKVSHTIRPTRRRDTASLGTACKFCALTGEPCGEDDELRGDGCQDAALNLNISAGADANIYHAIYTSRNLIDSMCILSPL